MHAAHVASWRSVRRMSVRVCSPIAFMGRALAFALALGLGAVMASADVESAYEPVLHVSVTSEVAADENTGTESEPLATLTEGLRRALVNRDRGIASTIMVHPGTYREALVGFYADSEGPQIVIEAVVPGTAIVSGADVWREWECRTSVCTHDWPFKWGFARVPWVGIEVGPLALRRELVVVDGVLMTQHLELLDALAEPGSFHVDEEAERLTLHLPEGVDGETMIAEVAMRPNLVRLQALHDLVIRGLVFQYANTPLPGTAVYVVDQRNVELDDIVVQWNNFDGLGLKGEQLVVRRSTLNHNGGSGVSAYQVDGLRLEDSETSGNNWRGHAGGFTGWAVGHKIMESRDVSILRHRSMNNLTRGLWLDWDNANVVIRELRSCGNLTDGLFVEISQGPVSITDSVLCGNGAAGLRTSASQQLEVRRTEIRDNAVSQLEITGDLDVAITDRITGQRLVLNSGGWSFTNNVVSGSEASLLVSTTLPRSYWESLMRSSRFWDNTYVHANGRAVFEAYGGRRMDFSDWQRFADQDTGSDFRSEQ
jgi:hypothetical protein